MAANPSSEAAAIAFAGVAGGDNVEFTDLPMPPMSPPTTPPPSPPAPPAEPTITLLARATTLTADVQNSAMPTMTPESTLINVGYGSPSDETSDYLLPFSSWPTSGTLTMMCYGGTTGDRTFTETFTLDSSGPYSLSWAQGCFAQANSGRPLSARDADRDAYGPLNCADYPSGTWPGESHGWGWQSTCHCGSLWDGSGSPLCFGMPTDELASGWCHASPYGCRSARVELWFEPE